MRLLTLDWVDRLRRLSELRPRLRNKAARRALPALRPVARIASMRPRHASMALASRYLHRVARPYLRRVLAADRPAIEPVPSLVRAMGGAGDLLMMTPGLRALARKAGRPVEMLIPARYAPLFEMNADVVVRRIEDLDDDWVSPPGAIDLTDCPAVAGELAEVPQRRNRRTAADRGRKSRNRYPARVRFPARRPGDRRPHRPSSPSTPGRFEDYPGPPPRPPASST